MQTKVPCNLGRWTSRPYGFVRFHHTSTTTCSFLQPDSCIASNKCYANPRASRSTSFSEVASSHDGSASPAPSQLHDLKYSTLGPRSQRIPRNQYRRGPPPCRAGVLEGFSGVSNLMAPEFATVFSAIIAITSVSINLYGGLLTEKRRAELAREVERERQVLAAQQEERSVVARYRGPLLEASVDLEARLYHIATLTGEWRSGDVVCEEEVVYTLFTLAQWLGFLEVIRREGPRERSFLNRGTTTATTTTTGSSSSGLSGVGGASGGGFTDDGGGGTDTLTTLVESFRFVLSAHPATLVKWYEQGDEREHPGCRSRSLMLRGTPALPDGGTAGLYGSGGGDWSAPAAPPPRLAPRLDAASWYGSGGGGDLASYGGTATPPPPTKPVMLYDGQQAAGSGHGGSGGGSELVIGSLDEMDLAAAGLGLPDPLTNEPLHPPLSYSQTATETRPPLNATDAGGSGSTAAAALAAADAYGTSSTSNSLSSLDDVGGGGGGWLYAPRDVFHLSRGAQRSIGSMMVITPMGASRHYTLSYGDFYNRYYLDEFFASWLRPVHTDILALVGGRRWSEQGPFPLNRWTRLLLLQQLLVETIELLDPAHVRVPANRRVVLAPVPFKQAPELETYKARMCEMSQFDGPLLRQQLAAAEGGPLGALLYRIRSGAGPLVAAAARWSGWVPSNGGGLSDVAVGTGVGMGSYGEESHKGSERFPPAGTTATTAASAPHISSQEEQDRKQQVVQVVQQGGRQQEQR